MAFRINMAKRTALATTSTTNMTTLEIRTGGQPAAADDAATGTLLATITGITWSNANGVSTRSASDTVAAVATGTAGWGRFRNAGDTERLDGVVGTDFTLNNTSIVSGGNVSLTSATVTQPAS